MNPRSIGVFLPLLLYTFSLYGLDPHKSISQYVHDVWQIEQGLPQNSVQAIVQTGDGYLWLGTQEGLVRFDGARFVVYDRANTPELKNIHINALLEDRHGTLWIGTRGGGLTNLRNGVFNSFTTAEGLVNNFIYMLYEDRDGNLWIATEGGLSCLKMGKFTSYTTKDGLSNDFVYSLCEDRQGNMWIGTRGGGLNRLKGGKFNTYTKKDGLVDDVIYILREDRQGSIWIGTSSGLNRFKDGKFATYTTKDGLSNDTIYSIYEDSDENLWIGTWGGGLTRIKNGKFTTFTTKNGLSNDLVYWLYEDSEANLWIGTSGGGLNRLKDGKFISYTTQHGLTNDNVRSLFEDHDKNLWIGTAGGGLNLFKEGNWSSYTTREGLSNDVVWSLHEDRAANLWIGTNGGGLNRFKNGEFTSYNTKNGLSNDFVRALYEDRGGNLWVGTRGGGLNRFKNGKFHSYTKKDGLSGDTVWALLEDHDGNLWIGTDGAGLNRFKNGEFETFTTTDGLSNDIVLSLHEDSDANLWIGTWGGGLNRLKDGKFVSYTTKQGLFDDVVFVILEDGKGNLWMSCNKGIFRVSKRELNDFAEGKIKRITSVSYGTTDGMKSRECNGASQPAGWKTKAGKLWFPTVQGVVVIDPENIKLNQRLPPVRIEDLLADNETIIPMQSGLPELTPGKEKLEFHYTALSLVAPEKVLFKYRLEGFDKNWVDAGTRRVAYYTNIPPGSYNFTVKACNNDGVWNDAGASFPFRLKPHFYQTIWFYALCVLSAMSAGWQIHQNRLKRLLELERIRMRIATDLHDDIGAGLTQICILSEVMQQEDATATSRSRESLAHIAESSRELIDSMSDIVWSVDPEKDHVLDLVLRMRRFANDILSGKNITSSFHSEVLQEQRELDPQIRKHIYLIYKESLNNLVRHSECTEADISLSSERNDLILIIKDNGKGLNPESSQDDRSGHGLQSMRQRAEEINAKLDINSTPGSGTTVTLRAPLRQR